MRPLRGTRRWSVLQTQIGSIDADVWVLTKTSREFSPGAGFHLAAVSGLAPDRTGDECWVAIWTREPAASLETVDPELTACASRTRGPTVGRLGIGRRTIVEMGRAKEQIRELLDKLPDDVSFEDVQYHIYVQQAVQRGIEAADRGATISQEEAERRMAKWLGE